MPKRIQRKRTKGWRMPKGAKYVGRPTRWGNPYSRAEVIANIKEDWMQKFSFPATEAQLIAEQEWRTIALEMYQEHLTERIELVNGDVNWIKEELRGKDLVCWCPLDQACHADVLLEIANDKD